MSGACGVSMRRARRGRPARRCAWLPAAFVALCSQEGRAQSEADGPLTVEHVLQSTVEHHPSVSAAPPIKNRLKIDSSSLNDCSPETASVASARAATSLEPSVLNCS